MPKEYNFKLSEDCQEVFLPFFSCFPKEIKSLKFEAFAQDNGIFKKRKILRTETPQIEYTGDNSLDLNSRYLVGVLNEKTGTIELHEATPVQMVHTVKVARAEESNIIKDKNYLARNELGQTFGTKKRQKLIKAQEMNKVNVEYLQDVASKIKETISENAPAIPLKADIDAQTMADRLIPPCNLDAVDPSKVYDFNDLFSESLVRSVDVKSVWKARTLEECYTLMAPLTMGSFLVNKITAVLMEKKDKTLLRILFILAYMFKMFTLPDKFASSPNLGERYLNNASKLVVNRLQELFLENNTITEKSRFKRNDKMRDKLLIYSLSVCFSVNNFTLDITQIAHDLKIPISEVARATKELGARVENKKVEGKMLKIASLLLPLQFPQKSRGQPK